MKKSTPEWFTGTHDDETVRTFLNTCEKYFKIIGISDENIKALFAKIRLLDTAHTWYNSQGCDETMVIFVTINSQKLDYFILSDYTRRSRRALVASKMG